MADRWVGTPRIKEQRQHEAEERAQALRKERIMREIELGALNTKRYRTLWREMMMKMKMPRIIEDMEIAWHNFDRAFDIKDYRISFLMDELAEAEEQCQKNVRSHTETIDQLLKSYKKRIERDERNYGKTLNETLDHTNAEVSKIYRQQNLNETLLQSITRSIQRQLEESLNNIKSIALSKIDAYVEDSKNIRRIFATQFEKQLQSSWEDLRQVLSDYQNNTKDRQKCYEALREKNGKDQQVIAQQLSRTASLFEEIQKFRGKITIHNATATKEISEILMEHDFFQKAYCIAKNRFLSEYTEDKNRLKILSIEYNKITRHLEHFVIKGKRLLMLMQICRKYETQDEKIIKFVGHTELVNLLIPSLHNIATPSNWDVSHQITDFQDLTNFWQRFGFVQIITMQLRSERDKLKIEANRLRECINCYMTQKKKKMNIK